MGPLEDLRVLDLSRLVAGGMLTTVLADFGAEVIKVEQPGTGDPLRAWTRQGDPLWWTVYSRNKKSVTLNLADPRGQALCRRLARASDVLVESFIPGTLERWGLGPAVLLAEQPTLVVVRISGWGQDGPYAHRPGFGTLVEAASGFAALTGFPDRPPVLPPIPLADMVTALYGVGAVLMALRVRAGGGQVIDLPLFDSLFSILGPLAAEYVRYGVVRERIGNLSHNAAPRNTYQTQDGTWIAVSASTQPMAERLLRALDLGHLLDDERFATNEARLRHREDLDRLVAEACARRTTEEILTLFATEGITAMPVYNIAQILADAHVRARGVVTEVPDRNGQPVAMHTVTPRLARTPGAIRHAGPALGQHNEEVYGRLGLSPEEIRAAREAQII
ncbi:MAG: CoA transferase [Armatimonadota bacterium]|nr:CoA transferase [Armatimonadota bacterium]MDR7548850.1 CoA transferase [Armatimonadota bacterium]